MLKLHDIRDNWLLWHTYYVYGYALYRMWCVPYAYIPIAYATLYIYIYEYPILMNI